MISVTDASRRGMSSLIRDAEAGRTICILRSNKVTAFVVGEPVVERLDRLDELEDDLRLMTLTLIRMATDTGGRFSLDEVFDELEIDLDETAEADD
jgi:antitoxin (DNA-binding transcriptional repressor) of toxin-antitoxin stability system